VSYTQGQETAACSLARIQHRFWFLGRSWKRIQCPMFSMWHSCPMSWIKQVIFDQILSHHRIRWWVWSWSFRLYSQKSIWYPEKRWYIGQKVRSHYLPLVTEQWIESLNSGEYPIITLLFNEFGGMNDLCLAINRRISVRKNNAFQFIYIMEQGKIYISSLIDSDKVILSDNLSGVRTLNKI